MCSHSSQFDVAGAFDCDGQTSEAVGEWQALVSVVVLIAVSIACKQVRDESVCPVLQDGQSGVGAINIPTPIMAAIINEILFIIMSFPSVSENKHPFKTDGARHAFP